MQPGADIVALNGAAWLAWLDQASAGDGFSNGAGRVLADGPYAPPGSGAVADIDEPQRLARRLLKRLNAVS